MNREAQEFNCDSKLGGKYPLVSSNMAGSQPYGVPWSPWSILDDFFFSGLEFLEWLLQKMLQSEAPKIAKLVYTFIRLLITMMILIIGAYGSYNYIISSRVPPT